MADVPSQHLRDAILGAVVDDDELETVVGLSEDALDRIAQQIGLIVDRQDDADQAGDVRGPRRPAIRPGGRQAAHREGPAHPEQRATTPDVMGHRGRERARALPRLAHHPRRELPQPRRSADPSHHDAALASLGAHPGARPGPGRSTPSRPVHGGCCQ